MSKIVIYTTITNDYDNLLEPLVKDDDFEFIYYSDKPRINNPISIWSFRKLIKECESPIRTARYHKTNPHLLFPENDISIWMDSNLQIIDNSFFKDIKRFLNSNQLWGGIKHPFRNCIYDEANCCIVNNRINYHETKRQIDFLKSSGFPHKNGLMETNILVRRHHDPLIIKLDELWWEMINKFTHRDQLSQQYVFWKEDFKPSLIFNDSTNTWNHPGIKRTEHQNYHPKNYIDRKKIAFRFHYRRIINKIILNLFGKL